MKVVLGIPYCPRCAGDLATRSYRDDVGVAIEVCECLSCNTIWQIAKFLNGEVRLAEIGDDEDSPEEAIPTE